MNAAEQNLRDKAFEGESILIDVTHVDYTIFLQIIEQFPMGMLGYLLAEQNARRLGKLVEFEEKIFNLIERVKAELAKPLENTLSSAMVVDLHIATGASVPKCIDALRARNCDYEKTLEEASLWHMPQH